VCGVFFTNSGIDLVADKISPSLSLRGPDSTRNVLGQDFSILFTRLSIRDLEGGDQPYTTNDRRFLCAINGELYNIADVRNSIYKSENSGPTGDMQLLAEYLCSDINNIKKARGMFAGFLYDIANKKLTFFRDSVGEKPLYYFYVDGEITVSSTIAAIVEHHDSYRFEVNKSFLYKGHSSPGNTIFEKIYEVLPGEYIDFEIQLSRMNKTKYWNWPIRQSKNTREDREQIFEMRLLEAARATSCADVPICMLLSGGLDSAAVLSALGSVYEEKVPSFTLAFENKNFDESGIAKLSAHALGSNHRVIAASYKDLAKHIPKMLSDLDSPILDPAFLPLNYLTSRIKGEFGFKVAITGDGGDELFRGYELYKVRDRVNIVSSKGVEGIAKNFIRLILPLFMDKEKRNSAEFLFKRLESVLQNPLIPWFETALSPYAGTNVFTVLSNEVTGNTIPLYKKQKVTQENIEGYYCNEILPQVYLKKSDNGSMVNGMELRVPFLHQDMINFAFGISSEELESNSHKWLICNFLKNKVPYQVLSHKKHGFSVPLSGILTTLEKPNWNLQLIGLDSSICDDVWRKACNSDANAARAGFALMVLNSYLQRWNDR